MNKIVPFYVGADQKAWLGETSCILTAFKPMEDNALHLELIWVRCGGTNNMVTNGNPIAVAVYFYES